MWLGSISACLSVLSVNFSVFTGEVNGLGRPFGEWPTSLGLPDPFAVSALILNLQVLYSGSRQRPGETEHW